ncbi:hypothetical protein BJV82DRAFT_662072 [Fennellomyces sp. T-0311]|nr:hypothetical protein BJV82DRAFT_662072 [Fennellomyces sp. T-0311]
MPRDYSWIASVQPLEQSMIDMRAFAVGDYNDPRDLMPIFTNHRATLESVSLTPIDVDDNWETFMGSFGNFASLQAMELFCIYGAVPCTGAASLLRKSPGLVRLHLGGYIGGSDLIDAIVHLPNLQELQFTNTESTSQYMRQLFQDLISKGSGFYFTKSSID